MFDNKNLLYKLKIANNVLINYYGNNTSITKKNTLFILDWDVKNCAQYHVDKYVVKMILETASYLVLSKKRINFT